MAFLERIFSELKVLKEHNLYREIFITKGISFITNDYLGLSEHPEILKEASNIDLIKVCGSGGSRLLAGNYRLIEMAEQKISEFFGSPAALIFGSGYLANIGAVSAISEFCESIISDESNHASLIDGIRLSGKPKKIIPHNEWKLVKPNKVPTLIISESLFSMDGDFVDFDSLKNILNDSNTFLIMDEAHAAGIFPPTGKIISSRFESWENLLVTITFGKAFGVYGAAILCSKTLKEWLINKARSFIYSTSLPPHVIAMIIKSIEISEKESWRREKLWEISEKIKKLLVNAELLNPTYSKEPNCFSPIIPIIISGERKVIDVAEKMREKGFEIRPIRYPTVKKGMERLRISLSISNADFSESMIKELIKCLRSI